jgi:MYND finger
MNAVVGIARLRNLKGRADLNGRVCALLGDMYALQKAILRQQQPASSSSQQTASGESFSDPDERVVVMVPTGSKGGDTPSERISVRRENAEDLGAGGGRLPRGRDTVCWVCGAKDVKLRRCGGCACAVYCGADCQRADWSKGTPGKLLDVPHRRTCGALKTWDLQMEEVRKGQEMSAGMTSGAAPGQKWAVRGKYAVFARTLDPDGAVYLQTMPLPNPPELPRDLRSCWCAEQDEAALGVPESSMVTFALLPREVLRKVKVTSRRAGHTKAAARALSTGTFRHQPSGLEFNFSLSREEDRATVLSIRNRPTESPVRYDSTSGGRFRLHFFWVKLAQPGNRAVPVQFSGAFEGEEPAFSPGIVCRVEMVSCGIGEQMSIQLPEVDPDLWNLAGSAREGLESTTSNWVDGVEDETEVAVLGVYLSLVSDIDGLDEFEREDLKSMIHRNHIATMVQAGQQLEPTFFDVWASSQESVLGYRGRVADPPQVLVFTGNQ